MLFFNLIWHCNSWRCCTLYSNRRPCQRRF